MGPQSWGILILGILGLPLGSPGTKCHLDVGPVASHRIYYKGEVQTVVSLVSLSLLVTRSSTKSAPAKDCCTLLGT
jgi:hypothetical protein